MTLTCPRCDGTGLIDICYNNNPNREYTIRCDYCEGDAVIALDDDDVQSAEFWGQRCKDYLTWAKNDDLRFPYWLESARLCAVYAGTCGLIALDNADPIVRIS